MFSPRKNRLLNFLNFSKLKLFLWCVYNFCFLQCDFPTFLTLIFMSVISDTNIISPSLPIDTPLIDTPPEFWGDFLDWSSIFKGRTLWFYFNMIHHYIYKGNTMNLFQKCHFFIGRTLCRIFFLKIYVFS